MLTPKTRAKIADTFAGEYAACRQTVAADLTTLVAALQIHHEPELRRRAKAAGQVATAALAELEAVARQFAHRHPDSEG